MASTLALAVVCDSVFVHLYTVNRCLWYGHGGKSQK